MRIALITFSRAKNYGGILQAFALYKYLTTMGHEVHFIDYITERGNIYTPEIFVKTATAQSKLWGKNALTRYVWKKMYFKSIREDYLKFSQFIEKECLFSKKYFSYEELIKHPPVADLYVTGSDQIWNSDYAPNKELELPFYLGFTKGNKISYASSFGKKYIPDNHKAEVKKLLEAYDFISVREESGRTILSELGIESNVVLDPTLLFTKTFWDQKCQQFNKQGPYILLYQVKYDSNVYNVAKFLAETLKLKLVILSMNQRDKHNYKESIVMTPEVGEWLSYIKEADLVYTDSFHAIVFSILFHVSFVINSASRKDMSTRIVNLLEITNLHELEMTNYDAESAYRKSCKLIDWEKVDVLIENRRKFSKAWLNEAIKRTNIRN